MFDGLPPGGDVYLFSRVLGGWSDEKIVRVLENCLSAMGKTSSRSLIFDRLIEDQNSTVLPALWDLHLLVMIGGRHRTLESFGQLLKRSGFVIERTASLPAKTMAIRAAPN
jgi:hypothetical protein